MQPAPGPGPVRIAAVLAESHLGGHAAGRGLVEVEHRQVVGLHHVPDLQGAAQGLAVHRVAVAVDQAGPVQFAQDGHDAAGPVHVFHVVELGGGGHLGQVGHLARQAVDVLHGEVDARLPRRRQQVQHGVGGAAHGDVQAHGVLEGLEAGDVARQGAGVVLLVIAPGQVHGQPAGAQEQLPALGMGGQQGAVAGQGKPQGLGQAVHGIGGEHAGAGAAGGAGGTLGGRHLLVRALGCRRPAPWRPPGPA
jgi:hypothetical protein